MSIYVLGGYLVKCVEEQLHGCVQLGVLRVMFTGSEQQDWRVFVITCTLDQRSEVRVGERGKRSKLFDRVNIGIISGSQEFVFFQKKFQS